ncbi:hypothetical protein [Sodalis sp. RH23]|uniref:hypothetical protein n=1 Tax=unclassified Sodalis (in: enterobacteria) TaxID=2636512 RepID=UPI0039B4F8EF
MNDITHNSGINFHQENILNTSTVTEPVEDRRKNSSVSLTPEALDIAASIFGNKLLSDGSQIVNLRRPDSTVEPVTVATMEKMIKTGLNLMPATPEKIIASSHEGNNDVTIHKLSGQKRIEALLVAFKALSEGKAVSNGEVARLALLENESVKSAAAAKIKQGMDAFTGGMSQGVIGGVMATGVYRKQTKANNMDLATIKHDKTALIKKQGDLNIATMKSTQGNIDLQQRQAGQISAQHQSHLDEAAKRRLERDIAATQHDIELKDNKTAAIRNEANMAMAAGQQLPGFINGMTQMNQAHHGAEEFLNTHYAQSFSSMSETARANVKELADAMQSILEQVKKVLQDNVATLGQLASRA